MRFYTVLWNPSTQKQVNTWVLVSWIITNFRKALIIFIFFFFSRLCRRSFFLYLIICKTFILSFLGSFLSLLVWLWSPYLRDFISCGLCFLCSILYWIRDSHMCFTDHSCPWASFGWFAEQLGLQKKNNEST